MHRLLSIALLLLCHSACVSAAEMSHSDSLLAAKRHASFAVQYKKSGEYTESLRQYKKSIAFNDTAALVHSSFAELLTLMNRPGEAKAEYLRTLALNPDDRTTAFTLAKMYHATGAYDSALVMYEIFYRTALDHATLDGIADLREYTGADSAALAARERLFAQGDSSRKNLRGIARLALKTGDSLLVITGLEKLSRADSTDDGTLADLEKMYRARSDTLHLIATLERRLLLAPRDARLPGELAAFHFARGETVSAERYARREIELVPQNGQPHLILGEIHRMRGETAQARTEYHAALDDPRWRDEAARLLAATERPEPAVNTRERRFFNRKNGTEGER